MNAHKMVMLATAASLVLVFAAGCSKVSGRESEKGPQTCVMALFDLSGTTKDETIRKHYLEEYGAVLKACHGGEALVGEAITGNPLAEDGFPINMTLPVYSPLTINQDDYSRALEKAKKSLEEQASALVLNHPPTKRTDIFNALLLAEKILDGDQFGKVPNKVLVIFSDMRQDSPDCNFDKIKITSERTQRIINELKTKGQLPNLTGVKVWVAGAGVSEGPPLSADTILAIQRFWLAYFKACGADLTPERYAPALINFALAPA